MIKLNDTSIFVGQIKQLLHTFNLPQCQIGNVYPRPNTHFLIQDNIMYWDANNKAHFRDKYVYGQAYLNLTGTLPIRNLIYDRETHQYLGKYLRFLRDYFKIDLMSMYNCCDNSINTADLSFIINAGENTEREISFKSGADDCTVYSVPASIANYTIATHSQATIELCIYVENSRSEYEEIISNIAKHTYMKRKINGNFIYKPFDKIFDADLLQFVLTNSNNIKLLIKVTEELKTSLVVLEGEYLANSRNARKYYTYKPVVSGENPEPATLLAYFNKGGSIEVSTLLALDNKGIWGELLGIAATATQSDDTFESNFDITAQLLSTENTNSSYLLADKLIEYLSGNVILPISEPYEIKRAQQTLDVIRAKTPVKENILNIPQIEQHRKNYGEKIRQKIPSRKIRGYGVWHKLDLQDYRTIAVESGIHNKFDCIGYVDKDLETLLRGVVDNVEL